jgi:isopenicillin N synthase-like dioxygenase
MFFFFFFFFQIPLNSYHCYFIASETMLSYSKPMEDLDQMVQRMIFESYGLEKYHDPHNESTYYLLWLMKYRVPETNESNIVFRAHTDKSFTAYIHQICIDGLQITMKDVEWIACKLLSYSFVFFAGDALLLGYPLPFYEGKKFYGLI